MSEIRSLEPKSVFGFFDEISAVPRSSQHNEKIGEYLVQFAKDRNLEYYQDAAGNVIIYKEATPGYETADPVMIQGHMDMVAAVAEGYEHDFENEPLDLYIDGDYIKARGTTLGADDGIAVAMGLALLDAKDISHPALEIVITTDEEIGMLGAEALDGSKLHARKILNLDSEEEGILTVGCAGATNIEASIPVTRNIFRGALYKFAVQGLRGGHSGSDIEKERGNAIHIAGRVLEQAMDSVRFHIVTLSGGSVTNAICSKVTGEIIVDPDDTAAFVRAIQASASLIRSEYEASDPDLQIIAERDGDAEEAALDEESQRRALSYLVVAPYGVQNMSMELKGLVETSLSTGVLRLEENRLMTQAMIRSSVNSRRDFVARKAELLVKAFGGTATFDGAYGAWEFNADSDLLRVCVDAFERHFGRKPEVGAVHAGLECGKWAEKLGKIDAVSLGPDMMEVHSPNERLSISSTDRTWEYLKAILEACR